MSALGNELEPLQRSAPAPVEMVVTTPSLTAVSLTRQSSSNDHDGSNMVRTSRSYSVWAVGLIFGVPALGGGLFGYDISVTSYVLAQLVETATLSELFQRNPLLQGFLVAASSLGAWLGSLLLFQIADTIGRRAELRYGAALYLTGAAFEVLAGILLVTRPLPRMLSSLSVDNVISEVSITTWLALFVLMLGRLVYGVGIACAMHGGPTYISEMAPTSLRGLLVSLKEAAIVLGIVLGYVMGHHYTVFSSSSITTSSNRNAADNGWMYAYGSSAVASSLMLVLSWVAIPRSCRWLLLQGRHEEALESMRFVFRDEATAQQEFLAMKEENEIQCVPTQASRDSYDVRNFEDNPVVETETTVDFAQKSVWDMEYRAPMTAGIGLVVLQQITGQPSILSYATQIFKKAGLSDSASILVAVFKLMATLAAAVTVEQYGRKKLLYSGITLMLLALLVLMAFFGSSANKASDAVILIAMFAYIGGYQFSFGPITWLMISEVFPLTVRGQAVAIAVQMNFLCNAVVQLVVPSLERYFGLNILFGIFSILTLYSLCFVKVNVPETKGLTLEQIERQFREHQRSHANDVHNGNTDDTEPLLLRADSSRLLLP